MPNHEGPPRTTKSEEWAISILQSVAGLECNCGAAWPSMKRCESCPNQRNRSTSSFPRFLHSVGAMAIGSEHVPCQHGQGSCLGTGSQRARPLTARLLCTSYHRTQDGKRSPRPPKSQPSGFSCCSRRQSEMPCSPRSQWSIRSDARNGDMRWGKRTSQI